MSETTLNEKLVLEMAETGVIYGHKKSKTHPKMKPYISLTRNEIELFKPEAVVESLEKAKKIIKELLAKKSLVLAIGTGPAAKETIKGFAETHNFPYVVNRWLGGTLTNFPIIRERINYYLNLKSQKEKGGLSKYTKKEQVLFNKELTKLSLNLDGLVKLDRLPDAIFVVDPHLHSTAVREAKKLHIAVIAIIDNNDDPEPIDYPIIANDRSRSSIQWVLAKITE